MSKRFVLITLVLSFLFIFSQIIKSQSKNDGALPNLSGEKAIEKLKEAGQYDSLSEAFKATRKHLVSVNNLGGGWTQEAQKVAAGGAINDSFGKSVAIDGDTAVIGAWFDDIGANVDQGSAYVFVRSGTTWTQQAQLNHAGGEANDYFGISVAIDGDTVVVGAYLDDLFETDQGSAVVFTRSGVTWSQQAQLFLLSGAANDQFGVSVAIDGNTAVIGAFQDDLGSNDQGSAYVFTRSGVSWTLQQQLAATGGTFGDQFGVSVGVSGNTAIVGAFADDVGANNNQGSAYIFTRSGVTWTQQGQLTASDGATDDQFGESVSISGESVIVGSSLDNIGANSNQGSAYVFVRSGVTWTQQQKLTAVDGAAEDVFGGSVAIDGNIAIIGAYQANIGANGDQGAAYIFSRSGSTWTQDQKITATGGAAGDQFGLSVAIFGNRTIVGAPSSDASVSVPFADNFTPNAANQGAMFVFFNTLIPTAAEVSVSGRVLTPTGAGLQNAVVYLTKPNGEIIQTRTTTFGYYQFKSLEAGQTVTVQVNSKRFTFTPQLVFLEDNIADLDFTANPF